MSKTDEQLLDKYIEQAVFTPSEKAEFEYKYRGRLPKASNKTIEGAWLAVVAGLRPLYKDSLGFALYRLRTRMRELAAAFFAGLPIWLQNLIRKWK